jgi:hypothetical protein
MRGIGHTFSRLVAARAIIAGAALLTSAAAQGASAQSARAERAMPANGDIAALPRPLDTEQATRVRRIFRMQEHGDMQGAARETALLADPLLSGHIRAARYLGNYHRATVAELQTWLAAYADHPDAQAIHALLLRRLPAGSPIPAPPPRAALAPTVEALPFPEEIESSGQGIARNPMLDRTIAERGRAGNVDAAGRLLAVTKGLNAAYDGLLRAELAQMLSVQNRDAEALRLAARAFRECNKNGGRIGLAGYIGGLAAWRLGQPETAVSLFESAAEASVAAPSLRAAASFWAARSHLRQGDQDGYLTWLARAATDPRSFYALLARRTLELTRGFDWSEERLSAADIARVAAIPGGWRAFALLQVGEPERAEAELRGLWPTTTRDAVFGRSLLLVARAAGLMDLAAQLAELVPTADGRPRDVLRFRVPYLQPRNGFRVDPALIYALTRLESNFDPAAVSRMGARGLMQIMPVTAGYISDDPTLAHGGYRRLQDAALNLDLGQRYVAYLARQEPVDGDLIRLLASYNAGPGSLAKWSDSIRDSGDPLLFIEAIPNPETRRFVQNVLAYTWLYAERLRLPAPSLDELAAGAFPRFTTPPRPIAFNAASFALH